MGVGEGFFQGECDMNDQREAPSACETSCRKVEVPTQEEVEALNAMREVKERARSLKKRLSEISASRVERDQEERSRLEREIMQLKSEWEALEQRRKEAARRRMVLLGHEEP